MLKQVRGEREAEYPTKNPRYAGGIGGLSKSNTIPDIMTMIKPSKRRKGVAL